MNSELVTRISNDLKIFQFQNESYDQYISRVLYSSIALWMKTITLDGATTSNYQKHSISKNHFHSRGDFILDNLLEFFPKKKSWYENDKNTDEHPINFIRARLLRTQDILQIGNENRVSLSPSKDIQINEFLLKVYGLPVDIVEFSSGLSILKKSFVNNFKTENLFDVVSFVEKYFGAIQFEKDEWSLEKEYFDPFIKTDTLYQSWVSKKPKCSVYFSRIPDKFDSTKNKYFIEKSVYDIQYSHKINNAIIDMNLLNKYLVALRHKYENPITVTIEKYVDHFILKRYVKSFYGREETFIQSFGWPIESLYDNLNWCFPIEFYDDIVKISEHLLFEMKEVEYE